MFTTGSLACLVAAAGGYGMALIFYLRRWPYAGRAALAIAFVLQGLYLLGRGWLGGVFVPNPIFEGPFLLPWSIALIILIRSLVDPDAPIAVTLMLVIGLTLFSIFYPQGMIPPSPKKLNIWALFFFTSESMAHALFYIGAGVATMSLFGKTPADGHLTWIVWGFIAYTIAQVTGAVWCFLGWGNTFSWGARHLGSAAIWTFFAACLHMKFIPAWNRRNALVTIVGAMLVFFISYGNYLREMRFPRVGG
ncbi:hypothetical protein [Desulfosarcina ovata]|uniref:C-type cytochrome biogenesis protein CcsB n=1 Tax=Desulfosarcina ovata subsp. ovata TaxID=2752305 RepID=A0A5K8ACB4_9BACT|nr:hypothetical protein [Desulfosarcina ovata]BBO90156.1 c-type cytochrome biogenesis protein CcsB [Desulfosarcina ovata subsp. ovata]